MNLLSLPVRNLAVLLLLVTPLAGWAQLACPGTSARICPVLGTCSNGCSSACASVLGCTEATTTCPRQTFSQSCTLPAMTDMRISVSSETCGAGPGAGPGLEVADDIVAIVNGDDYFIFEAPDDPLNGAFASGSICFTNPGSTPIDVEVSFTANRQDECVFITISFASLGTYGGCSALPVELTYFHAQTTEEDNVLLEWQTAWEEDNSYFAVEHSLDGARFETIGRVDGLGTTLEPQSYSFLHAAPLPGINYYRLRQVDFDGVFSYSRIQSVQTKSADLFRIRQTAARESLQLERLDEQLYSSAQIEIFDVWGRKVAEKETADMLTAFPIDHLSPGTYLLRLQVNGRMQTQRFLKW